MIVLLVLVMVIIAIVIFGGMFLGLSTFIYKKQRQEHDREQAEYMKEHPNSYGIGEF